MTKDQIAGDLVRAILDVGDVDPVALHVQLGQSLEAPGEHLDLGRRGALLRAEHGGGAGGAQQRVGHVAGGLDGALRQPPVQARDVDARQRRCGSGDRLAGG